MQIQLEIDPPGEILTRFYNSTARVPCIMGPLGSAKTFTAIQKILRLMTEQAPNAENIRPSRWVAVRNTYSDLENTTAKDWLEVTGHLGRYKSTYPMKHELRFRLEDGTTVESELLFMALDRPDAIKKLRGIQATGFWLNEMKELSKGVVDMADLRHGRYPSNGSGGVKPSWHGMIGDYNAPDDDHWLYKLAEEDHPENWEFFKQPGGVLVHGDGFLLNPNAENLINLPDGYYKNGMAAKSQDWIKVNLANEYGFVADGKSVYPEYVDSVHCMKEEYIPNPRLPIYLGFDFGRTPAAAFLQFLPGIGRWVGFDEFVTEDVSAATFAPELKGYLDREYAGFTFKIGKGDPAGDDGNQTTDDTPYKILKKHGIIAKPTDSNDPLIRRSSIINPMRRLCMDGKPAFMVSPKCKVWRKGLMGGFCYKRIQVAGQERYQDKPDKNQFSHICEAGEYALQGNGEGKAVTRGERRTDPKKEMRMKMSKSAFHAR